MRDSLCFCVMIHVVTIVYKEWMLFFFCSFEKKNVKQWSFIVCKIILKSPKFFFFIKSVKFVQSYRQPIIKHHISYNLIPMSGLQKVVIITELKILTPVSEEFCLLSAKLKILQVLFSVLHIDTNQQKPCRSQLKEILPQKENQS